MTVPSPLSSLVPTADRALHAGTDRDPDGLAVLVFDDLAVLVALLFLLFFLKFLSGRLFWLMVAFTTASAAPSSTTVMGSFTPLYGRELPSTPPERIRRPPWRRPW